MFWKPCFYLFYLFLLLYIQFGLWYSVYWCRWAGLFSPQTPSNLVPTHWFSSIWHSKEVGDTLKGWPIVPGRGSRCTCSPYLAQWAVLQAADAAAGSCLSKWDAGKACGHRHIVWWHCSGYSLILSEFIYVRFGSRRLDGLPYCRRQSRRMNSASAPQKSL